MAVSACCVRIHHNDCQDVFSSSQHVLSPSENPQRREREREIFCFSLSRALFCIQSTTDDIIIVAYRHHFQTYFLTLTREREREKERDTSFPSCQILLVIEDETFEIEEKKMTRIKYGSRLSRTMISFSPATAAWHSGPMSTATS